MSARKNTFILLATTSKNITDQGPLVWWFGKARRLFKKGVGASLVRTPLAALARLALLSATFASPHRPAAAPLRCSCLDFGRTEERRGVRSEERRSGWSARVQSARVRASVRVVDNKRARTHRSIRDSNDFGRGG